MKTISSPTTKIKTAEQLLQGLTLVDKPLDIPGNFRAKQRRTKHDDSKLVFPNPRKKESDTFKTHYNHQFRSKRNASPSSARPCSPTRRNNPHPSKNFLNWRIPTRVFDYGKVKNANVSFLKSNVRDSHQRFYEDYSGKREEDQLDPRQLMDLAKSYAAALQKQRKHLARNVGLPGLRSTRNEKEKVKLGLHSPSTSPIGIRFPNVSRRMWSPEQSSESDRRRSKSKGSKKSPSPHSIPQFSSWYDANNTGGMGSRNEDESDETVGMAFSTLKPEALLAIEDWLLNASDEERQIAMKFIEAIILASVEDSKISTETNRRVPSPKDAVPLQYLPPYPTFKNPDRDAHHHNHNMRKACEVCKKKELESALLQLQAVASLPMDVPAITELLSPLHPGLIRDREITGKTSSGDHLYKQVPPRERARHDRPKFIANKGSLFMNSKRPSGRHFTIHPEWH